jgi:hypothetical protein
MALLDHNMKYAWRMLLGRSSRREISRSGFVFDLEIRRQERSVLLYSPNRVPSTGAFESRSDEQRGSPCVGGKPGQRELLIGCGSQSGKSDASKGFSVSFRIGCTVRRLI